MSARRKMRGRGPGVQGAGFQGVEKGGVEKARSGGKRRVWWKMWGTTFLPK